MYPLLKLILRKAKLFLLFWRRIVFVHNHFRVSFWTKLRANFCGGFLADQYILYNLGKNKKSDYLSEFDWYRSRYINEPFDFVLNNKIVATEVLRHYTRVPEIYAIKIKGKLSSFQGDISDYQQILEMVAFHRTAFLKPYGKGKGVDVFKIEYAESGFILDSNPVTEADLIGYLRKTDNWMLCETMQQGSYARELYPFTTNTIRIITLREPETNRFKVFFAIQRIGTKETIPVDNGSRGGLVCNIDLKTGVLSEARSLHKLGSFDVHPDTHRPIRGTIIPGWNEILTHVLNLSGKLPYLSFIAWDLLVTDDGFCMIEANTSSGVNIIQLWGGQRNGELGDFYRHYKVIK